MAEKMKPSIEKHYWAMPITANKFHVFNSEDGRSLCGRWLLLFPNQDQCDPVGELEKGTKRDCPTCFKKAVKYWKARKEEGGKK